MDWKTIDAHRRNPRRVTLARAPVIGQSTIYEPIEGENRSSLRQEMPAGSAERGEGHSSILSRKSPGRSTRDTTNGKLVADATEAVIKNTCSSVPRNPCLAR